MNEQEADRDSFVFFRISNAHQFREALARARMLDRAHVDSPQGQERTALELAISRYLAMAEEPKL